MVGLIGLLEMKFTGCHREYPSNEKDGERAQDTTKTNALALNEECVFMLYSQHESTKDKGVTDSKAPSLQIWILFITSRMRQKATGHRSTVY